MLALVNWGGTFDSATAGTFQSDTGGTFHSDTPGTFERDMDGTFKVSQSTDSLRVKTLNDNPYMSMTWETGGLRKTNYFIYSSDNGDPVRDLIKM